MASWESVPRLRSAGLGTKLILFSTLLTILAVSSAFVALSVEIRRHTKRLLAESLARQQRMILSVQRRSLEQLLRTSTLMTDSPTLRAAMETYQSEAAAGGGSRSDLLATIQAESEKVARALGRDLLVITDNEGRVLAAGGRSDARPAVGRDLSSKAIVRHALEQDAPIGGRNFSVLDFQGQYFQVGCVPIVLQGFRIGTLALGDRLDHAFLDRLRESYDCEAFVSLDHRLIVSSLPSSAPEAAVSGALSSAATAATHRPILLRLGTEEYVSASLPLGVDEEGRPVTLHLLHSLSRALSRSGQSLLRALLACGALAVILASLVAWVISRSTLRPLRDFVTFMRSVAETGDHSRRFETSDASHEVRVLVDTYNQLIGSLLQHEQRLLRSAKEELDRVERLKESEKLAALGRLLSGAAHEINNPLTGVVGNIEILLAREKFDGEVRQRLETVRKEGRRIVALVRNLLKVAHRGSGERSRVDVNQVIHDTVALRQHDFTAAGMRIRLDLAPDPLHLWGNELELQQVFLNIINNAFDALKGGRTPTLTLRTSRAGDRVSITFADNGPGMESPLQVFDHFYTTKPVGQGTGLGLSISHSIIQSHGGQITAENLAGGGAQFTLLLPVAVEAERVAESPRPSARPLPAPNRSLPASVLVVDDEPSVLELQMAILDSVGASTLGVGSGAEAIALLKRREFDLIVSDLKMPGEVSGKDLFRWVETHRPAATRGFLFVTGDTITEAEFLEQVNPRCVMKPFTMEEYVSALREALHALRPAA